MVVARGLAPSRERAQMLIRNGCVQVDNVVSLKPSMPVAADAVIAVTGEIMPYVSRGGVKLEAALRHFRINVRGARCLDVGASTGGFTDCLLQRGANRVYAIDVGYGQLDYKLRQDSRVVVMERVNAHHPFSMPEKVNIATMDLSFISVTKVIPNLISHLAKPGYIIVLLKPQFEAERKEVGKGGIIKDPQIHARVLARFISWITQHDLRLRGLVTSPILGAEGNREFLILLTPNQIGGGVILKESRCNRDD